MIDNVFTASLLYRNDLNTGYDHGFAGSYQGGYGSAYARRPSNYLAGAASRLYS